MVATRMLDGDNVRDGLTSDLGFSEAHLLENIWRVAETAELMVDAGLIVQISWLSSIGYTREQLLN